MLRRNIFDCLPQRDLPDRNRSTQWIYTNTRTPSCLRYRTVSQYFHGAGTHPQKKKLFYTEYFQPKIYIRSLARSCRLLSVFSNVSPLGQRDFILLVYILHYSDWNLLRSDLFNNRRPI